MFAGLDCGFELLGPEARGCHEQDSVQLESAYFLIAVEPEKALGIFDLEASSGCIDSLLENV
jgi:hypothetical protein